MTEQHPVDDLWRGAVLMLVGQADMRRVVTAACDALVTGYDGDALRLLAGLSSRAHATGSETEDLIFEVMAEQGRPLPARKSEAAMIAAATAMAMETIDGSISPRALAQWAHANVTHGGPAVLQDLVDMDDRYDLVGLVEADKDLDAATFDQARRLIAAMRA